MGLCSSNEIDTSSTKRLDGNPINNSEKISMQKKTDKEINKVLNKMDQQKYRINCKLMLLGAGEGGKTTLLRQMRRLHGDAFTERELRDSKPNIIKNVVEAMRTLAVYSEILNESGGNTSVEKENELVRNRVAGLVETDELTRETWEDFEKLWNDKGIRNTFELSHRFQLIDTAEYLLDNMYRFRKPDYVPTFEDLVHSRNRSIGVNRLSFTITNPGGDISEAYEIYDVGGQRNERKKWVHFFDHINGIMYVAALSSFNQSLWEDARINRMVESLALFRGVVNMDGLERAHIILFLNKSDLFAQRIQKHHLRDYFPDYTGSDQDFEQGVQFIQNKFIMQSADKSKIIYSHISCATDPQNVLNVFNSVRDIVVRNQLKRQFM